MSIEQFNVATTFIFSQAYQAHPIPVDILPDFFTASIPGLTNKDVSQWDEVFINTARWLCREKYIDIMAIDLANNIHGLSLTEKGLRLLTSPSSLEKMESPEWGETAVEATNGKDFDTWREVGKSLIQEGTKLGLKALVSQILSS